MIKILIMFMVFCSPTYAGNTASIPIHIEITTPFLEMEYTEAREYCAKNINISDCKILEDLTVMNEDGFTIFELKDLKGGLNNEK